MTLVFTKKISVLASHSLTKKESEITYEPNYEGAKPGSFRESASRYLCLEVVPAYVAYKQPQHYLRSQAMKNLCSR